MTAAQRTMLFALFARLAKGLSPVDREQRREAITREVFGAARSWSTFEDRDVDRMKVSLESRVRELDLGAHIESEAYATHDAAQAAHVPTVRPGKPRRAAAPPRRHASRYEQETAANDPGARRRLVFWIERLFPAAYIRSVVLDLDDTADWQELPIPQLMALKDTLKNRLGKWLTRNKELYEFGFSIRSRNPRSTTGLLTNEEIIGELLSRGLRVDIREASETFHVEPAEVEEPFCNDPKLSDRGARRGLCAGEGGEGAKAEESIGRDVRNGSLQRMVRRCRFIGASPSELSSAAHPATDETPSDAHGDRAAQQGPRLATPPDETWQPPRQCPTPERCRNGCFLAALPRTAKQPTDHPGGLARE